LRSGARPEEQAVADAQLALAMAQWDLARRIWQAAAAAPSSAQLTADALAGGAPQGATGVAAGGGVGQLQASATASAAQTASESRAVGQADPQAAYLQAEVAAQAAQVAAEDLREGPGDAALRQTEADVRQAESALAAVQANRRRLDLTSPIHGRVMEVLVSPGDLTVGGATLLRLTDPTTATLTVYVSEADMADLEVGDAVDVTVKAYPGDTFKGTIGAIAQEAEFTPRSVQTEDQRAMLVFAVRVDLENPKGRLKSGMPAEATFTGR
jgi:multidrug resistance efflux pump